MKNPNNHEKHTKIRVQSSSGQGQSSHRATAILRTLPTGRRGWPSISTRPESRCRRSPQRMRPDAWIGKASLAVILARSNSRNRWLCWDRCSTSRIWPTVLESRHPRVKRSRDAGKGRVFKARTARGCSSTSAFQTKRTESGDRQHRALIRQ